MNTPEIRSSWVSCDCFHPVTSKRLLVLLTVFRYAVFRFVLVEKTKSAKNIWELVIEEVIILGFLMADTSSKRPKIYIFC